MDAEAFRTDIIRPALKLTELWSPGAENLVLGTALVESGLNVVKQYGGGPGLGFTQIEAATYNDVIKYLKLRQPEMGDSILSACYLGDMYPDAQALIWHLRLAVLITRVIYYRRPEPLPEANDVRGMALYWKRFYNTLDGKGDTEDYIKAWEKHA